MAGRELFVWYRVRREHSAKARVAVASMQQSLAAQRPGLSTRLLVRDDGGAVETWMESYADDAARGIDAEFEAAIDAAARPIAALIDGARHVEAFTAVP